MDSKKTQSGFDIEKWLLSEKAQRDLCGTFAFCSVCEKVGQVPCALAMEKIQKEMTKNMTETKKAKSFQEKLDASDIALQERYAAVKAELLSCKKIKDRVSKACETFRMGRPAVAKIGVVGKTLRLYLALEPSEELYPMSKYHYKDVSDKKSYVETPFLVKVNSDLGLKKALVLIGELKTKLGCKQ